MEYGIWNIAYGKRTHSRAARSARSCFRADRHHLSRPLVHFFGDAAGRRRIQAHAGSERLGFQRVHVRIRGVRNSEWMAWRPVRRAIGFDAGCVVVVGVHGPDRGGLRLQVAARHPVTFRRGRSGRFPEHRAGSLALVPATRAGARDERLIRRFGHRFGDDLADCYDAPATAKLAMGLCRMRDHWRVVAWRRWFRDLPEEHPAVNEAEMKLIRGDRDDQALEQSHRIPWKMFFTSPNLAFICLMYFAYGYGLYFYITWLPTYLLEARRFSVSSTKWLAAAPWIVSAVAFCIGGWTTDWLARRTGNLKLARCGIGVFGYAASAVTLFAVARVEGNLR